MAIPKENSNDILWTFSELLDPQTQTLGEAPTKKLGPKLFTLSQGFYGWLVCLQLLRFLLIMPGGPKA